MSEFSSFHTTLGGDGRVVIPAPVRKELGLHPGDMLVVESDGQSLLVRSSAQVLQEDQDYFRQFVAPGTSPVDALIADRRAEAARENATEETSSAERRRP